MIVEKKDPCREERENRGGMFGRKDNKNKAGEDFRLAIL